MSKKANADRQISVGDKAYTLRFSVRAMAALQDYYELPSIEAVGRKLSDSANLSVDDMVTILWAGFQTHHREITRDACLDLLDELGIDGMASEIAAAFDAASPTVAGEGEGAANPKDPGQSM